MAVVAASSSLLTFSIIMLHIYFNNEYFSEESLQFAHNETTVKCKNEGKYRDFRKEDLSMSLECYVLVLLYGL